MSADILYTHDQLVHAVLASYFIGLMVGAALARMLDRSW